MLIKLLSSAYPLFEYMLMMIQYLKLAYLTFSLLWCTLNNEYQ